MKLYIHSENYGLESVSETVMDCFDANTALMLKNDAKLNNIWFWFDSDGARTGFIKSTFSDPFNVQDRWSDNDYVVWLYRFYPPILAWFWL